MMGGELASSSCFGQVGATYIDTRVSWDGLVWECFAATTVVPRAIVGNKKNAVNVES